MYEVIIVLCISVTLHGVCHSCQHQAVPVHPQQVRYVNVNGQLRQEIVGGPGAASTGAAPPGGAPGGGRPQTLGNIIASRDPRTAAAAASAGGAPESAGAGGKPLGMLYIVQQPPLPGQQPPGLPPGLRPGAITGFPPPVTAGPGVQIGAPGRTASGMQAKQDLQQGGEDVGGQPSEGDLPSPRGAAPVGGTAGLPPLKTEVCGKARQVISSTSCMLVPASSTVLFRIWCCQSYLKYEIGIDWLETGCESTFLLRQFTF
jgi:hypothetical protein